ncbi:hypothetical protein [Sphaerothrix gracilis]|uniref:hypothetical protein n=1 Tax=Sphaerothrix gracilis TaxID=3151835 RepID=UPI0031FC0E06
MVIEQSSSRLSSYGDIWQFGKFNRGDRCIEQDLSFYRVPTDLEDLSPILIGILTES